MQFRRSAVVVSLLLCAGLGSVGAESGVLSNNATGQSVQSRKYVVNLALNWSGPRIEGHFGNSSYYPITEICLREDKCIWGNLPGSLDNHSTLSGNLYLGSGVKIGVHLDVDKHKVFTGYHELVWEAFYGGILGDEIWLIWDYEAYFNAGNIYRGSIYGNPIVIYGYHNGHKTDSYWEFYR